VDTLAFRDTNLELFWSHFADIAYDPDTEKIEEDFLHFPAGTDREDIWRWFDERHSKGVAYLLYRDGVDRTDEISRLYYLKQLCFECDNDECPYIHRGECRFALVHGKRPKMSEIHGCLDYDYLEYREGEK